MSRLYVGHIPYEANEKDVERFFKGYGKIRDILVKKGFAFVELEDSRACDDAIHDLNGKSLMGMRVVVDMAKGRPNGGGDRGGGDRGGGDRGRGSRRSRSPRRDRSRSPAARKQRSRSRSPRRSPPSRDRKQESRSKSPVREDSHSPSPRKDSRSPSH